MGGFGSGRRASAKEVCEEMLSIDLAYLRQREFLRPGRLSTLSWSRHGHQVASIRLIAQAEGVVLSYTTKRDGVPLDVCELVPFVHTGTAFGGRRAWFGCLGCRRPCRLLYAGRHFRCRRCHGLAYRSEREAYYQRAMGQAEKLRKRIGRKFGRAFDDDGDFPPKPPRMRWRTYEDLEQRYTELQNQGYGGLLARIMP